MIYDANRVFDGFSDQTGGVDGGRDPDLIDLNKCSDAENVINRGGRPKNRPGMVDLGFFFDNPNLSYNPDGSFLAENGPGPQSLLSFENDLFQGASYYRAPDGNAYIMATIGGRLFQIDIGLTNCTVREIRLARRNRSDIPIVYHVQADAYLVVQDGESQPIIFDGIAARRAIIGTEIPMGTMMAYGMNRIVLVRNNGDVEFGNIRNGKGGGGADVLGWDENSFLAEGFPSAIPAFMGKPTAVAFIPAQDTATGVGECVVFGENGIEAFNLGIPRETWKDSFFQRTALLGAGNLGHRNPMIVNQDLFFRDRKAGWRSYRQARAQINEWAQIPLSTEMRRYIDNDTPFLLQYGSAIEFDNRLLSTSTPQANFVTNGTLPTKPFHNGILALDFDPLSSFGRASGPAWQGRWLDFGLNTLYCLQLVTGNFAGVERAFCFCIGTGGTLKLREITKLGVDDNIAGGTHRIASRLVTRSMDFSQSGATKYNEKELYGADIWLREILDTQVDFVLRYKPDQIPTFRDWNSFSLTNVGTPGAITPGGVPTSTEGFRPRREIAKPDESADPVTTRLYRRGYEFQTEITWTGHAAIHKFRLQAQQEIEEVKANNQN